MNELDWRLLEDRLPLEYIEVAGVRIGPGSRVRLLPRKGGDILDLALAGQIAIVDGLEEDYEGRPHVAVLVENDPGFDLGMLRQPGHRFFFAPDEIEPIEKGFENGQGDVSTREASLGG
jgi:hypothetical protein